MIDTILLQMSPNTLNFIMIGGMVVVFYLFMIRPQQKKQKDQKLFREQLKKGDAVITIGGIYGKITGFEGETVFVEVDKGMKIKIEKSAISSESTQKLHQAKAEKAEAK